VGKGTQNPNDWVYKVEPGATRFLKLEVFVVLKSGLGVVAGFTLFAKVPGAPPPEYLLCQTYFLSFVEANHRFTGPDHVRFS